MSVPRVVRRASRQLMGLRMPLFCPQGYPYRGLTASETVPRQQRPGPLNLESWLAEPHKLLARALQPWQWLGHRGTVAADTDHYPFRTQMHIPGYGWAVVEDTGENRMRLVPLPPQQAMLRAVPAPPSRRGSDPGAPAPRLVLPEPPRGAQVGPSQGQGRP